MLNEKAEKVRFFKGKRVFWESQTIIEYVIHVAMLLNFPSYFFLIIKLVGEDVLKFWFVTTLFNLPYTCLCD